MEEDRDLEMPERNVEEDGLVSKKRGDSKARVVYRADVAKQRGIMLAVMIVPIILMVILWLIYDSNSKASAPKSSPPKMTIP